MTMKKVLLGSTALVGIGLFGFGAQAAEIKPLGNLDVGVGGFARWYAFYGDLKGKTQSQRGHYDFRNDFEVFIYATGKDEATGLDYGARIEMEADGDSDVNGDETWVWVKGNFGEFRFGDEDGGSDLQKLGGADVAVFSGGIDGVGPIDLGAVVDGPDSGDNTKALYITPNIAGFNAIISFAPHGGAGTSADGGKTIGFTDDGDVDDLIEGGIAWVGAFGNFNIKASVIGAWGHFNTGGDGDDGGDNFYKIYTGTVISAYGFQVGGGWGFAQGASPTTTGGAGFDRGADYQWYNFGVGTRIGPAKVSFSFGNAYKVDASDGDDDSSNDAQPYEGVIGAEIGVAPGLVIGAEVAYFDLDIDRDQRANNRDPDGFLGLVGLRLAF